MEISNTDNIIDSRDVIERIEELEDEIRSLIEERGYEEFDVEMELIDESDEEYWDLKEELDILKDLEEQCEQYAPDWEYGEALIHEDYFVDYCEQLLRDIGDLPNDIPWYIEIDWEATAENLKMDYSVVDFYGETYYIR